MCALRLWTCLGRSLQDNSAKSPQFTYFENRNPESELLTFLSVTYLKLSWPMWHSVSVEKGDLVPSCLDLPYSSLSLTCNGNSPVTVHFAEVSNNSPESPRENLLPVCTGRPTQVETKILKHKTQKLFWCISVGLRYRRGVTRMILVLRSMRWWVLQEMLNLAW